MTKFFRVDSELYITDFGVLLIKAFFRNRWWTFTGGGEKEGLKKGPAVKIIYRFNIDHGEFTII